MAQCDAIEVKIISTDSIVCLGDNVVLQVDVKGAEGDISYKWLNGKSNAIINEVIYENNIFFSVNITVEGCDEVFTAQKLLHVKKLETDVEFDLDLVKNTLTYNTISNFSVNTSITVDYEGVPCDTCHLLFDDSIIVMPKNGLYKIFFQHEFYECKTFGFDTLLFQSEIGLKPEIDIYIPNAFVPNSINLKNREFKPYSVFLKNYELSIYDRGGRRVFECSGDDCFWNGRDKKGNLVSSDNYYYLINVVDIYGFSDLFSGTVFVLH
jgi:gliding motility-associated-like protein